MERSIDLSGRNIAPKAEPPVILGCTGQLPNDDWPAVTMGFKADPRLLEGVAVGDQVDFILSLKSNDSTVTAFAK